MNIFEKIKFLFRKPKVIIVAGDGRQTAKEVISQVLKQHFKVGDEILIFETELTNFTGVEKFNFLVKNSSLPVLVVTHVGDIPPDKDFFAPLEVNKNGQKGKESKPLTGFAGEREKTLEIQKLAKLMPAFGYLILNFDDKTVREIKDETNLKELTFGFQEGADFRATDVKLNTGTNFKISYKGNIVPVWLEKLFGKEQVYSALSAAAVGTVFGLNLVEISQVLKAL